MTYFLPTDAALARLPVDTLNQLGQHPDQLKVRDFSTHSFILISRTLVCLDTSRPYSLWDVLSLSFLFDLTYSLGFLVEHRASTTVLHWTRFCAVRFSSPEVTLHAFISSSHDLRQVIFGRPTLLFPCGFHSRA